jgi:hypothetical protein
MGWGAEPWGDKGASCEFNSPEMVDAFTFLHEAAFDKKSMPGPGTAADFFAGESDLVDDHLVTQADQRDLRVPADAVAQSGLKG